MVKAGRRGQIVGRATRPLAAALDSVAPAAQSILAKLRQAYPHDITVEFGLKLAGEVGAVITQTTGECNLKVTLRWVPGDGAAR